MIAASVLPIALPAQSSNGAADMPEAVDWKAFLPEAELTRVLAESVKVLQDATKSQTNFNTKAPLAENEAYVLIIYAEAGIQSGDEGLAKRSAALQQAAAKLAEACKDKKLDEAKKQVAAIANFKNLKPADDAKPMSLGEGVPIKNLMKSVNESDKVIKTYRRLTATQFNVKAKNDEIILNSLRMAALTGAITAHAPAKDEDKKKTRKHWLESTAEVREATIEMANAAKAKKPDAFKTALTKMDSACVKCHDVFRESE
jgi:cytochrome c556